MNLSFRNRLTLFFVLIVVLPMVSVGAVIVSLVNDSEEGRGDARLSQAQTTTLAVYRRAQEAASGVGRRIGEDPDLAAAIRAMDESAIRSRLSALVRQEDAQAVLLRMGERSYTGGDTAGAVAPATSSLRGEGDAEVGRLRVSVRSAEDFTREVADVTGLDVIAASDRGVLFSTLPGEDGDGLGTRGEAMLRGREFRYTTIEAPGFEFDSRITVRLLADQREANDKVTDRSFVLSAVLVAFLVMAFGFALLVSRSLQAQVQRLLDAAKRLGKGEFSIEVPTEGDDEFAALGSEFNAMARQLESRLEELQQERARLQEAIRRVGESFAKGLDRDALLEIVVQTAMDGVGADCGRATARDGAGRLIERARAGDLPRFKQAIHAVEAAALDGKDVAEVTIGGASALAHPLHAVDDPEKVLGIISVARDARPFSAGDRELFNYLANQAAVSIENVDLHEAVQRQAVTDELTGLFNHRRFQEVVATEVERARRFGSSLGLIMLDIDNFKEVNDTYGHLQGDLVLREVARVLLDTAREIDEPARYGGEEMAVALPQTDLEGAYQFAERLRQRIESLELPVDGTGERVRVTASFGAAAVPESSAHDKDALVAAADAALYRAKRTGKNRVVRAS